MDLQNEIERLKKENEELKMNVWRFNELIKVAAAPWDFEIATDIFWFSDKYREMLGFENEIDFPNVTSSWSKQLFKEDAKYAEDSFNAHIEDRSDKTPYNVKYRVHRKDGTVIWVHEQGSSMRDKSGNAIRVFGTASDITEEIRHTGFSTENILSFKGVTINFDLLPDDYYESYHLIYASVLHQCKTMRLDYSVTKTIKMKFVDEYKKRRQI